MKNLLIFIITVLVVAGLAFVMMRAQSASLSKQPFVNKEKPENLEQDMPATKQVDTIVLGEGCFWGAEKRLEALPGVIDAEVGYADGRGHEPTYAEITKSKHKSNPDNYAEVVKVTFNPQQISLETIIKDYFESHDPTQLNRQGNDVGTQYRSTILTNSPEQAKVANRLKDEFQVLMSKAGYGKIVTVIKPLDQFHPAEEYHQDYLLKNPNGYCPDFSTGVTFDSKPESEKVDNSSLLSGKQIVIVDSQDYCPYCEKFKKDVANDYQGTIPMTFRYASQLDGLETKTPTWATPTILFIENGTETLGYQGYLSAKEFYKALGYFKLGDSEAFNVAFQKSTDGRFCKQYEIFKDTPDGVFVDKLSGQPLFDTRDRFNSGTGWLSFTKPVDGSVTYHEDNSFGMQRTELRSASTGIHLGHVFDDGPNGKRRYCINATVLEFVPREKL
ncbi:peptide-methionine (S)-S-oxide reductase MsrA [Kangiella koreensis]|uniref:Peptide methionine sulfoxide reductase MsrA n=1 Tax=Kangiella koreensis (strain DSM 16069 / JCM 12317 / KCTC 12182 / SW-125) TaxID=523791 RepID=C7R842_KANKD|nr:peptide-methionine (S)-S-oxide reductase MsrA [Kangiella koreensis]ACV25824.1 peptide methionine sulfoxide reductase [Kangiella koreensis DSM 16069]